MSGHWGRRASKGVSAVTMVGKKVMFQEWNDDGVYETHVGVVESEFKEPVEEDRYQRLNYRVRAANGECYTPYAHECSPA